MFPVADYGIVSFNLGPWKRAFVLTVSDWLSPPFHVVTFCKEEFLAIKAAGYTDTRLVDISLALAVITFTNAFNRINDTTLDFPPAA